MCVSSHCEYSCKKDIVISSAHSLKVCDWISPKPTKSLSVHFTAAEGIKSCHLSENRHATLLPSLPLFSIGEPFNCLTSILNGNRNAKKKLASDYGNVLVPVGGSKENITTMHSFSIR